MESLAAVENALCRALDVAAIIIDRVSPKTQAAVIQMLPSSKMDRTEEILGMEMVCCSDRLPVLFCKLSRTVLERERFLEMDNICPFHSLFNDGVHSLCELVSVGLDKAVENWHPVICEDIIRLWGLGLMIVAREDSYIHSRLFQSGDCPSRGS